MERLLGKDMNAMKCYVVRGLILLLVLAALSLPVPVAHAATTVTIDPIARVHSFGMFVEVRVRYRCEGIGGLLEVQVEQARPGIGDPATGSGATNVLCDGNRREALITVSGNSFNTGRALAQATLFVTTSETEPPETYTVVKKITLTN